MMYCGLMREKTFANFTVLWLFTKVLGRAVLCHGKSEQSIKFFSANMYYSNTLSNFTGIDSIESKGALLHSSQLRRFLT